MTLGPCGDRCYCLISHLYGSSRISWSLRTAPRWDPVAINDKTQVFLCFRSFRRGGLLFWGPYCLCCGIKSLHDPHHCPVFERCHHRLVDSHRLRHCVPWMIGTRSSLVTKSAFFFVRNAQWLWGFHLQLSSVEMWCNSCWHCKIHSCVNLDKATTLVRTQVMVRLGDGKSSHKTAGWQVKQGWQVEKSLALEEWG